MLQELKMDDPTGTDDSFTQADHAEGNNADKFTTLEVKHN